MTTGDPTERDRDRGDGFRIEHRDQERRGVLVGARPVSPYLARLRAEGKVGEAAAERGTDRLVIRVPVEDLDDPAP